MYRTYLLLISFVRLMLSLVFVLPGNIMSLPLSTAIAFYAEQERIKALKSSSVKVKANEEARKKRMCASCPYGCPWETTNKYIKVKI